ncbi:hypothetical protein EJ04DRAFT_595511 [Polyplosphaeria fusca]|uniref:Rhodopsin domain-containing protein n=1 Tax=Polyplosphaeria fusca TaxID=682080 RepID=A0A9P4UWJ6_9PLEO|nr:hypothetical protein EJ04DRAFT_595511 [Polyplosphaeria fusca]
MLKPSVAESADFTIKTATMASTVDLSQVPAGTPPPGVAPNLIDPLNLIGDAIACAVVVLVVTFLFMLARFYVNVWTHIFRVEDYCSYIEWAALLTQVSLSLDNVTHGSARHTWDTPMASTIENNRRYNMIFIFYAISGGFAKATVFLQFKRIFTTLTIRGTVYWVIVISLIANAMVLDISRDPAMGIYSCCSIPSLIQSISQFNITCTSVTVPTWLSASLFLTNGIHGFSLRLYLHLYTKGKDLEAYRVNKTNMGIGSLNTLSDIEAFFVPAWAIWKCKMDVRKKLSVFAVFAIGALAVAIGCLGMHYRVTILRQSDKTWRPVRTDIVCIAELGIVIIVGCCPYLPRIYRRHKKSTTTYRDNRGPMGTIGSWKRPWREKLGILGVSTLDGTVKTYTNHDNSLREDHAHRDEFITRATASDTP